MSDVMLRVGFLFKHYFPHQMPHAVPYAFELSKCCPEIEVITGSDASIDMIYLLAADIYLGDVGSQVYEFL
jgi:hypothetical protein